VVQAYLQNRDRGGLVRLFSKTAVLRHNVQETILRLNELDKKRMALRPESKEEPATQAQTAGQP
jgi:hypothetical protein